MLDRLSGGDGYGPVPPEDLVHCGHFCLAAYTNVARFNELRLVKVLGALEASLLCNRLIFYIDGLGACGAGASLMKHATELARSEGAKCLMLRARLARE